MKIAICIPRHGDTKGEFTISLGRMIAHSLSAPAGGARPDIELFSIASSDLPVSRNLLLQKAIEWQARYLLWLDADHIFPAQSLLRLLSHQLPMVGCNYARRREPPIPVAARIDEAGRPEHVWTTEKLAREGVVEEVSHVGLGLCLMDMAILHQVKAHVEKGVGWAHWNPFDRKLLPGTTTRMGEDASFFEELRAAGVKIYVDHALSWHVGHIGDHIFTNAEAEAHRNAISPGG